jgi:hypothetical protein
VGGYCTNVLGVVVFGYCTNVLGVIEGGYCTNVLGVVVGGYCTNVLGVIVGGYCTTVLGVIVARSAAGTHLRSGGRHFVSCCILQWWNFAIPLVTSGKGRS